MIRTVMTSRTILHIDMDAFFAAVEQRDRPQLKGLPVVVGSAPDQRGVVSTCSYEARRFGIHSAMPSRTAYARCPQAVFLPVRMQRYREVSSCIMEIFRRYTPMVAPLSLDEAFLDCSGSQRLFGSGPSIARTIKAVVRAETGLTCSVGVAPNMFLAKIASDLNKPDGLTVVPESPPAIVAFLTPLPVERMWGAGRKTQAVLAAHGIRTIGDLQAAAPAQLARWVGECSAATFSRLACGLDDRRVAAAGEEKSISNERTFDEDQEDVGVVRADLLDLVDQVGARLRAAGFLAGTARVKVRWKNFKTITRQYALRPPCCDDMTLRRGALELFHKAGRQAPIRLIGFGVSGLQRRSTVPRAQHMLFDLAPYETTAAAPAPLRKKRESLSRTVDDLRRRYGPASIHRGSRLEA